MVLTFVTGVLALAAIAGFLGWVLTGDAGLWWMFVKSGLATIILGVLLSGALIPVLWPDLSAKTRPATPSIPRDEPFDSC